MPRQKESGIGLLESVAQALDCNYVSDLHRTDSRKLYEAFQALPAEGFPARLWLDALEYLSGARPSKGLSAAEAKGRLLAHLQAISGPPPAEGAGNCL